MSEPTRRSIARRLAGAAGVYGVAFLAPRVLRFVIIPLVVAAVGFGAYGTFVLVSLIIPFVHVACELGMGTAALRLAPHEPPERRASVFASVIAARAVVAVIAAGLLVLASAPLSRLTTGSADASFAVVFTAVTLVPFTLTTAFADQLRNEERHSTLARLVVVRELIEAALMFVLVIALRDGLRGLLVSRLCAEIALVLLMAASCRHTFRARPSLSMIGTLARLGAPIAFLYLLVCLRDLDRYLIKAILGVADAGRYDLALRIVGPVALGNAALAMVFEPFAFRMYANPAAGEIIAMFLRVYVVGFGTMAFAAAAVAPEVFPLLSPGAAPAAAVIAPALIFAFVGDGVLRVAGIGADFAKRTGAWIVVAASHLLVALPVTWLLLRTLGIFAAGAALLAGTLVASEVAFAFSRRLYPLELPVHRALAVIVVGVTSMTLLVGGAGVVAPLPMRLAAIPFFLAAAWAITGLRGRDAVEVLAAAGSMATVQGKTR
ncbi:MAG TPA: hypothetical protein VGL81_29320 [Polyangiaceae bacterium]|jgi:O-antigen/teichoic acid export membrane protein